MTKARRAAISAYDLQFWPAQARFVYEQGWWKRVDPKLKLWLVGFRDHEIAETVSPN